MNKIAQISFNCKLALTAKHKVISSPPQVSDPPQCPSCCSMSQRPAKRKGKVTICFFATNVFLGSRASEFGEGRTDGFIFCLFLLPSELSGQGQRTKVNVRIKTEGVHRTGHVSLRGNSISYHYDIGHGFWNHSCTKHHISTYLLVWKGSDLVFGDVGTLEDFLQIMGIFHKVNYNW